MSPGALIELLEDPPEGAYRIKGRISVLTPRGHVVNFVGRLIHLARMPEPPMPSGELVAIGLDLDAEVARARLHAVVTDPASFPEPAGLWRLLRYRRLSD